MAFWAICVVVFVGFVSFRRFRQWDRLRHIPGPGFCGWSGLWMLRAAFSGTLYEELGRLHKRHGRLYLPLC